MIELFFLIISCFLAFNILYEIYTLIIIRDSNTYIWKGISLILTLFLVIFGIYVYIKMDIIKLNSIILLSVFIYYFSALLALIIVSISYRSISKLKKEQSDFETQSEYFLIENRNLQEETKLQTVELSNKIIELENVRSAMINILEDTSLQNQELESSKEILEKVKKRLEKQNKELLSLDKQKDQFTSITAHELKTPLASIHGFVQLLKNEKIINDKDKREKYMSIILQDTERLSRLITDILDISRLDLGTIKFYFEEFDIRELVNQINLEMSSIVQGKDIKYSFKIANDVPKIISSDKNRLSQILVNLISNAVHYTDEGGKISINVIMDNKQVIFEVKDTGIGISQKNKKQIFERFYQVDSWLTRKIGGSGLGLAISKGLVQAIGGNIYVDSVVGKGSKFYFNIPIKQSDKEKEKYVKIINFSAKSKNPSKHSHIKRVKFKEDKKVDKKEVTKEIIEEKSLEKELESFFK